MTCVWHVFEYKKLTFSIHNYLSSYNLYLCSCSLCLILQTAHKNLFLYWPTILIVRACSRVLVQLVSLDFSCSLCLVIYLSCAMLHLIVHKRLVLTSLFRFFCELHDWTCFTKFWQFGLESRLIIRTRDGLITRHKNQRNGKKDQCNLHIRSTETGGKKGQFNHSRRSLFQSNKQSSGLPKGCMTRDCVSARADASVWGHWRTLRLWFQITTMS